jgi:hypothetical protein
MDRATFDLSYESYVLLQVRLSEMRTAGALRVSPQFRWQQDQSWIKVTAFDLDFTVVGVGESTASRPMNVPGLQTEAATLEVNYLASFP